MNDDFGTRHIHKFYLPRAGTLSGGWRTLKNSLNGENQSQFNVTHRQIPRTHKANWVGKVDQRMLYLTLEKSANRISLAIRTNAQKKKKLTEIAIKLIPGFMHRRAHIKDPARHPQVIQIQLSGSDDNIKNQWDNKEIYIMLVYVSISNKNPRVHT